MIPSILVVEDEPIIAEDLSLTLEDSGYQVAHMASSVQDAIIYLNNSRPNLVMLDINLDGDKDGIFLGNLLNTKYKLPFIYLTSYYDTETVNRAKSTHPAAYIIKPFDEKDLKVNLQIALHKERYNTFQTDKLFVKKENELIALKPTDILFVEAIDNYAYLYTENEKFMISHTLKSIEEKLNGKGFVRVHRSYLINFEKITSISEGMVFINNHHLPIGKSFRQALLDQVFTL